MFKRLYDWTIALAASPHATSAMAIIAFAESSFFPLPPDLLLIPMAVAQPQRAWWFAFVCTIASVLGGIVGYAIGALLYESLGQYIINLYGYTDKMEQLRAFYAEWGWAFILVKGLTPIPYKLVTIVSGLLGYDIWLFILLSIITRGGRFFILAAIMNRFGESLRHLLEKHFALFTIGLLVIVVAGFWLATKVI